MQEHYYSEKPSSKISEKIFTYDFDNETFTFTAVSGVFGFSNKIDKASELLIQNFSPYLENDTNGQNITKKIECLDLGCGFGAIGILLAHKYLDTHFTLTDINNRAIEYAKSNAIKANPKQKINVDIIQSNIFENLENKSFDHILCNPPFAAGKKVINQIITDGYEYLNQGGKLWTVAYHNKGGNTLQKQMHSIFGNATDIAKGGGIRVYCSTK